MEEFDEPRCLVDTIFTSNKQKEGDVEASRYLKQRFDEAGIALGSVNWLSCERCNARFQVDYSSGASPTISMHRPGEAMCDKVGQVKRARGGDVLAVISIF